MKALIWNGTTAEVVATRPLPKLRDDYLLIRVVAVAINPTDYKAITQGRAAVNGLLGCDFSGVVEEVGPTVIKSWQRGDRVFGCAHGANSNNPEDGAYADFIVAKGDTCMRIPEGMDYCDAATVAVSAITCGQGLFQEMALSLPTHSDCSTRRIPPEYLLVNGGSSSAGSLAIQYASLYARSSRCFCGTHADQGPEPSAGYSVITTCSPANNDLCLSRGAEAVFDYRDPSCAESIRRYTKQNLLLVWDTIGDKNGAEMCMEALADPDPHKTIKYGTILFNKIPRKDVLYSSSFLMTFVGEPFAKFGKHMPAQPENLDFAIMFTALTEELLAKGKLQTHPCLVRPGGLTGIVEDGISFMASGKVSGQKLVYLISDTRA